MVNTIKKILVECPKCGERKVTRSKHKSFRHCGHLWNIKKNLVQGGASIDRQSNKSGDREPDGKTRGQQSPDEYKQISEQTNSGNRIEAQEIDIEGDRTMAKKKEEKKEEFKCAGCSKIFELNPDKLPSNCPNCGISWE